MRWSGYPEVAAAPEATRASITGFWSPLVLGLVIFGLAFLAVRTRERSYQKGTREPRKLWHVLLLSLGITIGLWVLVLLIGKVNSLYICLAALGLFLSGAWLEARRMASRVDATMGLLGAFIGSVCMAWYFIDMGSNAYDWNLGLSGVLLLYVGFIGASMATHDGRHIRVDAVRKALKGPGFHLYNAISDLVALLFTAFLGFMAIRYMLMLHESGFQQDAARLPQWLAALPIALAFVTMVLRFGIRIADSFTAWRRRENAPELAPELH